MCVGSSKQLVWWAGSEQEAASCAEEPVCSDSLTQIRCFRTGFESFCSMRMCWESIRACGCRLSSLKLLTSLFTAERPTDDDCRRMEIHRWELLYFDTLQKSRKVIESSLSIVFHFSKTWKHLLLELLVLLTGGRTNDLTNANPSK